jgi:uncharacterized protein YdaU (DUF1376 family)
VNFYPFHIGDYTSATAHLSMTEDAAYRRLLDVYYTREAPIPADLRQACRLVRAQSKDERQAVEDVLREFFTETPEGWRHSRCDAEIAKANEKKTKAAQSAAKRWGNANDMRTHASGNANAAADAMPTHMPTQCEGNAPNPNPNPNPNPKKRQTQPAAEPPGFVDFWQAWPSHHRKANKAKCLTQWQADDCEARSAEIVGKVRAWARSVDWTKDGGQFIPAPAVWLNQRRYEAPAPGVLPLTGGPSGASAWRGNTV